MGLISFSCPALTLLFNVGRFYYSLSDETKTIFFSTWGNSTHASNGNTSLICPVTSLLFTSQNSFIRHAALQRRTLTTCRYYQRDPTSYLPSNVGLFYHSDTYLFITGQNKSSRNVGHDTSILLNNVRLNYHSPFNHLS